jgi:MFS family permease
VVIFPLVALAVLRLGWRSAAFCSGLLVLLLLPLVLLVRRSPESMGLLPDGERRVFTNPGVVAVHPTYVRLDAAEFTARQAVRTPAFWLLAAFHGLRNIPYNGVSVHLVPLLVWKGLDQSTAAFFVGLMAFSTVIVRPLTGWLGDRWSKQKIGALGVALGGLGLAVLLCSHGALWHMVIFVVLFSFGDGINSVTWALVGDFFGRRQFATIRGWIGMLQSLASMPAAVFTGWVYDRTQSYSAALLPFIILYGLGALVLWWASPPKQPLQLDVAGCHETV